MSRDLWGELDDYLEARLTTVDERLSQVLEANAQAGLPPHDVSLLQGKFLSLLARIHGAQRVLEIGTLGGFSTIWLARAVAPDGSVVTLEVNPQHAAVAQQNLEQQECAEVVQIRIGDALETLADIHQANEPPFDFVFIDADKSRNAEYLEWSLKLTTPKAVIVIDNVVRSGDVLDAELDDPSVQGVRAVMDAVQQRPELSATALQTVGSKGHDGFVMILVD